MAEEDEIDFDEEIEGENLDTPEKKDGPKITKEMAEKEWNDWAFHLRLDTDEDEMDVEEKTEFLQLKKKFKYCLINGYTETDGDGDLALNLIDKIKNKKGVEVSQIIFRRKFKGGAFVLMDRYKESQNVHKTIAFLGAWVNIDPKELLKLDAIDEWFGMKMVSLFFGA